MKTDESIDFQRFVADLQMESDRVFPTTSTNYDKVTALLLNWDVDHISYHAETRMLESVLSNNFYFYTDHYLIPSGAPTFGLSHKLATCLNNHDQGSKELLIIYYGGNAGLGEHRDQDLIFFFKL